MSKKDMETIDVSPGHARQLLELVMALPITMIAHKGDEDIIHAGKTKFQHGLEMRPGDCLHIPALRETPWTIKASTIVLHVEVEDNDKCVCTGEVDCLDC